MVADEGTVEASMAQQSSGSCTQRRVVLPPLRPRRSTDVENCCAFVTLAIDAGDGRGELALWQALPIAWALRRFQSRHPFVLLTNLEHFEDGKPVNETLSKMGIQVLRAETVPIPERIGKTFRYKYWRQAWAKLQIFRLTQFQKIVWMDSDAMVTRNLDGFFHREGFWMMRDTWQCNMKTETPCSGLMLLTPSEEDFQGLLKYAKSLKKLRQADQALIVGYFTEVVKKPPRIFENIEASFGHCLGMIQGLNNTHMEKRWGFESPWRMPAYAHKSSSANECFSFKLRKQIRYANGLPTNLCHLNPLSTIWRESFCSATQFLETSNEYIDEFCDDASYYNPVSSSVV